MTTIRPSLTSVRSHRLTAATVYAAGFAALIATAPVASADRAQYDTCVKNGTDEQSCCILAGGLMPPGSSTCDATTIPSVMSGQQSQPASSTRPLPPNAVSPPPGLVNGAPGKAFGVGSKHS